MPKSIQVETANYKVRKKKRYLPVYKDSQSHPWLHQEQLEPFHGIGLPNLSSTLKITTRLVCDRQEVSHRP
jgi:hypothetical protein